PKIPVASVAGLIGYLKANPGKVNYGSSGIGTSSHLSVVMFAHATGTEMTHIPFRSTGEVVNSMIGGYLDIGNGRQTSHIPHDPPCPLGYGASIGSDDAAAQRIDAGPPHYRGNTAGLRGHRVAGPVRAGRHTAADRRPARDGGEAYSRNA